MGRKRKAGPRSRGKSNRPSRAFKSLARDNGTHEGVAKRLMLVNGTGDQVLAATAASILFSNGHLDQRQWTAAQRYERLHSLAYDRPYRDQMSPLSGALPWQGGEAPTEDARAFAERRMTKLRARLTDEQWQEVGNVAVWSHIPHWFFAVRLRLRVLPEDERARQDLIAGLDTVADVLRLEKEPAP